MITKSTNSTIMEENTFWTEIEDAPGEIFDIPEMRDEEDNDEDTWNAFLNSNWDF